MFWLIPRLVFHVLLEPKKPIFILHCHLYVRFCLFLAMAATLIHLLRAQLCPSPPLHNDSQRCQFSAPIGYKLRKNRHTPATAAATVEKNDKIEKPLTPVSPPPKLERKNSLESEPKTLLQEEMDMAREAALKIINSHTQEEALKIFLTGLVPVETISPKQVKENVVASDCDEDE
ncbi:unnamed protein product [Sphenostylis stenocarpa]|uniref:Uncharacterized protein n=1 Tax=Sphenostylis stenocarpa TaxID=92480 RepID=A0AA86T5G5_9FABA|nr:unnamed protein product [Sphenostylis stenocarpa]